MAQTLPTASFASNGALPARPARLEVMLLPTGFVLVVTIDGKATPLLVSQENEDAFRAAISRDNVA